MSDKPTVGSILADVKLLVNVPTDYDSFDRELIMHINAILGTLHQIGVGPKVPLSITDETTTWDSFLEGKVNLNSVKTYLGLKLGLIFDPPPNSYGIEAVKELCTEFESRLQMAEETP